MKFNLYDENSKANDIFPFGRSSETPEFGLCRYYPKKKLMQEASIILLKREDNCNE